MTDRPGRRVGSKGGEPLIIAPEAQLRLLEEMSTLLSVSTDPVKACHDMIAATRLSTSADFVSLEGVRLGDGVMQCRVARGALGLTDLAEGLRPLVKTVLRTGKPVVYSVLPRNATAGRLRALGLAGLIVVPVKSRRSTAGALCFGSRRTLSDSPDALRFYRALAACAGALIGQLGDDEHRRVVVQKYDSLFHGVQDAVLIFDAHDGTIIDVNPRASRLTGYNVDKLLRMKVFSLHPAEDHPNHRATMKQLLMKGSVAPHGPVDFLRENGKRVPAEVSGSLLTLDGKHLIVEIVRDLSEQKRAEVKMAASEELLRIIVEGTMDLFFFVHNPKGAFTYLSPSVEKITGHPREYWKSRNTRFLTSNPINEQVKEFVVRAVRDGIPSPAYLCEILHADGRPLLLEINEKPILKAGRVIGVQGVARDITERKRLEEAILESRDNLNRILDQTPLAVMVCDARGNLVDVNEAWMRMFGAPDKESVVGRMNVFQSRVIHSAGLEESIASVYKGQIVDIPSITIDPRIAASELSLTGVERTVHLRMFPVTDRNERLVNVVAMIEDVTEKRRLEEKLIQSQKMESIGLLAGGIAHDFNNILGAILGYASFVKSQIPKEEKIYPHIETIERSAQRAAELTSQLLAFARGGKYVVGPMSINDLVTETSELLRGTIEKSIAVETELDPSAPVIEADASQIQQVLMNLCVNARDAMPVGGRLTIRTKRLPEPDVFLRTVPDAHLYPFVRIDIIDTGVGIDKTIRNRIFDPFFTTKGKGKGTGLGLATVYGIVNNHGGMINVESEVNVGTTFSVYIPSVEKAVPMAGAVEARPLGGRETVLVVDDEENIRMLVRDILEEKGYAVLSAGDGFEAMDVYREHKDGIDLVILDMAMPGMGGRETYEKLVEMNPGVRVILSTGYSKDERARELLARGVKAFVQKPYRIDDLASAVRKVLDAAD